ncbi:unnamed protein product [Coccothraustes coccothraustes]
MRSWRDPGCQMSARIVLPVPSCSPYRLGERGRVRAYRGSGRPERAQDEPQEGMRITPHPCGHGWMGLRSAPGRAAATASVPRLVQDKV